jgi:hypothetical protein
MEKYYTEIKWAFIFILTSLFWMVLEKVTGLHSTHIDKQQYLTMGFMVPAIWIYVLALNDKKKKDYRGRMTFKQGFISGLIISVIVTLFSPLTQWITTYVITPEFFPNVIEYSLKTGYHKTREEAEAFFNFENYVKQGLIGAIAMGTVTSLIVAFFVKSKR